VHVNSRLSDVCVFARIFLVGQPSTPRIVYTCTMSAQWRS